MSLCYICGKFKRKQGEDPIFLRCSCMVDERFEELTKAVLTLKNQLNDLYEKINREKA